MYAIAHAFEMQRQHNAIAGAARPGRARRDADESLDVPMGDGIREPGWAE
jgi:hypothetical protein